MTSRANDRDKLEAPSNKADNHALSRRNILLGSSALVALATMTAPAEAQRQRAAPAATTTTAPSGRKPNILVILGDDIGQTNVSAYSFGVMGYSTPNIDRIANEGMMFTDYYAEQSCTAGRASFITGQATLRTGLSKVGLPGADLGLRAEDMTIAEALKPLGYATGQFGKNHLGDRNEFLPTVHGFDEFFGNLYHLNAEEEPENPDYPKDPALQGALRPARRAQMQSDRPRRCDSRSSLRPRRQADDRGHRPADQEAHGNDRRRNLGRRHRLHQTPDTGQPSRSSVGSTRPVCTSITHVRPSMLGQERHQRIFRRHDRTRWPCWANSEGARRPRHRWTNSQGARRPRHRERYHR